MTNSRPQRHATLLFMLLLGAMSSFPPVTTDIYLPALPELTRSLHGSTAQGQATLAFYFLGLGTGQVVYGAWADRAGRRLPMLVGVALYLVATLGCAVATSIQAMFGLRLLQALGACSGVVISAAVARDRYDHQESARVLSTLLTLRGLGPILAPIAGGAIVTFWGWRAIFWALTGFGVVLGLTILLTLPETRPEAVAERARTESPFRAYAEVLRNPRILGYLATNGLNFGCMFAWIAAAPYLIIGAYRVPALYFGWIFALNAAGFMLASQLNRRLLKRIPSDVLMTRGAVGAAVVGAILLADALTGFGGAFGVMIPLLFVVASLGLVSTNAMAGGLAVDPSRAGAVSALFGTSQFGLAGVATVAGSLVTHDPAKAMAVVIFVSAIGAAAYPVLGVRRRLAAA